jgi:acyl-CoA synthetase (NDP forming)
MAQTCLAFSFLPGRFYRGLSVAGGGGALGIAACDAAEAFGLEIPPFAQEVRERVNDLLPKSGASGTNPVDVANPFTPPQDLEKIFLTTAQDERIDLQILILLLHQYKGLAHDMGKTLEEALLCEELAERMQSVVRRTGKPIVFVAPNAKMGVPDLDVVAFHARAREVFLAHGFAVFGDIWEAMRAIGHVNRYYAKRESVRTGDEP